MTSHQRLARLAASALLVVHGTGCHSMKPVSTAVPPNETPRAIGSASVSLRDGTTRILQGVVVRADSVIAFDAAVQRRVAFAHDEVVRIERRQFNVGRTGGLVLSIVALAVLTLYATAIAIFYNEGT